MQSEKNKIFIGNLPFSINEEQIREIFEIFGEVANISIPTDRDSGRKKGFAFVTFSTQESAEKSLEKDGAEVNGRKIRVSMAHSKSSGGATGQRRRSY